MSTIMYEEGIIVRKISFLVLIIFLILGWSQWGTNKSSIEPHSDIQLIKEALSAACLQPGGGEIHAWAQIGDTFFSPVQAEAVIEAVAKPFGLNRYEYDICLRSTGDYGSASMEYCLSDKDSLHIEVKSLRERTTAEIICRQSTHDNLETRYYIIQTALAKVGATPENVKITSCLEGFINARLRSSEIQNIVYSSFREVAAEYRGAIDANGAAVWSGWSPFFASSVDSGEKQVNFGISFRWDAESERTIVWMATPVLPSIY